MVSITAPQMRRCEATVQGKVRRFSPLQFAVLLRLVLAGHKPVTESELIEWVWPDPDFEPDWAEKALSAHIRWLRVAGVPVINRRGFGWMLAEHSDQALAA